MKWVKLFYKLNKYFSLILIQFSYNFWWLDIGSILKLFIDLLQQLIEIWFFHSCYFYFFNVLFNIFIFHLFICNAFSYLWWWILDFLNLSILAIKYYLWNLNRFSNYSFFFSFLYLFLYLFWRFFWRFIRVLRGF